MTNQQILISGASIAGPALAYWLRRYGFQPTIVERAPAPRQGGQAVDLRGTARHVAERMGILADVRRAHTGAQGMAFVNRDGRRQASMSADLLGDSGGVIAELEILRGDLVRILYDRTRHDVEYIFDDTVTELIQDDNGVLARFERAEPRRFDLVIGADGLHSTTRRLAFGQEADFAHDLGAYVAIFGMPTSYDLGGWELFHTIPPSNRQPGKTAGLYPLGKDKAYAMFVFSSPDQSYDRKDTDAQKRLVAQAFDGEGWQIPAMLDAMWQAPDFYFDRLSQIKMDSWSRGRIVLVGDAASCASPMAGNGTSLALVGSYVLAGELATAGSHEAAFQTYEHEMREYVSRCQKFATNGVRWQLPTAAWQITSRNLFLRVLPYIPWKRIVSGGMQKLTNTVTLKDYEPQLAQHPTPTS